MQSCQDLWDRALGEVEVEVSKAVFLTLFKRTSLLSLEEGIATIAAPSMMVIDLLQRRFYQNIKTALDKQTGFDTKIVFVPEANPKQVVAENVGLLFSQEQGKISVGHLPRVRPEFTFDNMAVSGSNQLAFVSATSVAKKMGDFYNPLFLYGPVGVGKTHLMQAIANDVYLKDPRKKILYITSEEFTNEVVEAIRTNSTSAMKRRFRNLDLLLIDDVQFLAGKEKVQEELFHTFNILIDNSSQIVLSSDRIPNEIPKVEKRLLSRFSGGLTVDIEPPDFELRCAIVLIKAKKIGVPITIEGAKIIAERLTDARALEGCLLRIATQSDATGEEISLSFVEKIVDGKKKDDSLLFGPDEVIENVCSFYKIRPSQIRSAGRSASLVRARQVAMYLLKKELGLSFSEIGSLFGGRDHTTVMHGVGKISLLVEKNKISLVGLGTSLGQKSSVVDY